MEIQVEGRSAFRQTWRHKQIRALIAEIVEENPGSSEDILRATFRARLREDEDYFLAAADYAFDAGMRALEGKKVSQTTVQERAQAAAASAQRAAEHTRVVKSLTEQILMLNLEMPNGKRMRHCTGQEMTSFGRAYEKIGRKVGKTKTVGEVLSEKELRQLLAA